MCCITLNTIIDIVITMKNFGETIRELRSAQNLGLRDTAIKVGISPAYLSRIERGKEHPPKPEIIKSLAKILAADPDILFRISSSTDPEIKEFLNSNSEAMRLIRLIHEKQISSEQINKIIQDIDKL